MYTYLTLIIQSLVILLGILKHLERKNVKMFEKDKVIRYTNAVIIAMTPS